MAPSDTTTDESVGGVYDALAPIYDALGGGLPFARLIAERLEPLLVAESGSFLDLGCGTGELLCLLRTRRPGWRRCGVDLSPGMLAFARSKPANEGVLWVRARLPEPLPFGARFDVVGSFSDTLNHLPDLDALAATFLSLARVMRPDGLLVFDLNNAFGFESLWKYRVAFDLEGHHVDTRLEYDPLSRSARAAIALEGGGIERQFLLRERCFSDAEVEGALVRAGLTPEIVTPWSPVDRHSPSKTWFVASNKHAK